jgi:hypothetical protein
MAAAPSCCGGLEGLCTVKLVLWGEQGSEAGKVWQEHQSMLHPLVPAAPQAAAR